MKMRRGFRTEAEEYAAEFRAELGVATDGALCPFRLAALLAVPVVPLSQLNGFGPSARESAEESVFSATTLADGTYKMIVHNDSQHPHRQNSNVMHEIAHILLGHPAHPPLTEDRCRNFNTVFETEAKELGFTLLISKLSALRIVESGITLPQASILYGASRALIEYRIRITDANGWALNRRKKQRLN